MKLYLARNRRTNEVHDGLFIRVDHPWTQEALKAWANWETDCDVWAIRVSDGHAHSFHTDFWCLEEVG